MTPEGKYFGLAGGCPGENEPLILAGKEREGAGRGEQFGQRGFAPGIGEAGAMQPCQQWRVPLLATA